MSFVFNPDGKKVLLSIDGGGMRGVIPLSMLVWLEEQSGRPAYELFDMVAGTSTGAIIAAGLGLGMTARQLLDEVYRVKLPQAFGHRGPGFWLRYIFSYGMRHLYPPEPFIEALSGYAEGKTVQDLGGITVLMTTKDMRTGSTYYIVNHGPGAPRFAHWPVSGAVAASSSAPIYFRPVGGNLIDGGVGVHANPCLAAAIEAVDYIGYDPAQTLHISLGTGFAGTGQGEGEGGRFWLKQWVEYIIIEQLGDAALQQVDVTKRLYPGMDFRRYNPDLKRQSVGDALGLVTGSLNPEKFSLDSTHPQELELMVAIGQAYASLIDWLQPGAMPWDTPGGHAKPGIKELDWSQTPYR